MTKSYYLNYKEFLMNKSFTKIDIEKIELVESILKKKNSNGNSIYIYGNGGSSSIASHFSTDLKKNFGAKTHTFVDPSLVSCFSNDYGFDNALTKFLKTHLKIGDLVILISSSGMSKNVINAAKFLKKNNFDLVTFTGFKNNNLLRKYGCVNIWVDSEVYNIIENIHQIYLLSIIDSLAKVKLK